MSPITWVLIAVGLAILEMCTVGFIALWMAVGAAVVAVILAIFPTTSLTIQLVIFVATSLLLVLLTKNKFSNKIEKNNSQSVFSILGKTAIVTKEINSIMGIGQINVNGDFWSAKSSDPELIIPANSKVEVLDIDGVRAVVKLIEPEKKD